MPPKTDRNVAINIKPEELVLQCEWMDCKESYVRMEQFTQHVTDHLTHYLSSLQEEDSYLCHWRECNTELDSSSSDYLRHVLFHVFHVKIKCIGALLNEKTGRKACNLGTQCRNLIPELPERLECGWESCHQYYENAEMFYRHVENHVAVYPDGNNVKMGCRCQWEGCNVKVKSRYRLREHLRSHTQEKVVACPTCGNLFSCRTKYFDHVTRQMDVYTGKRYQCSHCNRTFPLERILRDHMRNHVNQYKCPYCDMTLPSPSCLRKHIRYRHTDDKPFACEECSYRCKSMHDLKRHVETHRKDKVYECYEDSCTFSTSSYANLTNHIKSSHQEETSNKYQCHVCDSCFTRGSNLTKHLKHKHNFSWPSGHSRFRYKLHPDGLFRLQTVRYETVELAVHPDVYESGSQGVHNNSTSSEDQEQEPEEIVIRFDNENEILKHIESNTDAGLATPSKKRKRNKDLLSDKTKICKSEVENEAEAGPIEVDNQANMVELSITQTNDGKFLLKTAGCSMEEPMTITMNEYGGELEENMYNLQMLGDVALQNQSLN